MATICPYCNIEVSETAIEAEDGCCPECGSIISASSSFLGEDPAEFNDALDDDLFQDIDEEEDDYAEHRNGKRKEGQHLQYRFRLYASIHPAAASNRNRG